MPIQLWEFTPSIAATEHVYRLYDAKPRAFEVINEAEVFRFIRSQAEALDRENPSLVDVTSLELSDMPRPRFRITDPGFANNVISMGLTYISARLARTLDLGGDAVQYVDVDCSACPAPVQAMGYKVMNLRAFGNPMDRQRMPGEFTEVAMPDGGITHVWRYDGPRPPSAPPLPVWWRQDFVAPAPLFRVPGGGWTLATDDLAEKVMRAGFPDVAFIDVTNDGSRTEGLIDRQPSPLS